MDAAGGIAGIDRAGAVAHNAARTVHHGVVAVVCHGAEGRAVHNGGVVAGIADDAADKAVRAALGIDDNVRPAVADEALDADAADEAADVGIIGRSRIAVDRAGRPAALDDAVLADPGRQKADARVRRGLVVDRGVDNADVADGSALAYRAEEACLRIGSLLALRADGHAGDRMIVAVEAAVERARRADGRPRSPGQVQIGIQTDVLALIARAAVDGCGKGLQLRGRADEIRVALRAAAGREDRSLLRFGLTEHVLRSFLDGIAAQGRAGHGVELFDLLRGLQTDEPVKKHLGLFPIAGSFRMGHIVHARDRAIRQRERQRHRPVAARTRTGVGAALVGRRDSRSDTAEHQKHGQRHRQQAASHTMFCHLLGFLLFLFGNTA